MENEMRNGCSNSLVQEAGAASKSGQACMEAVERHVLHTYNRYPIVFARGEGVYLYDTEGKQYLDFASGIGVQALGYGNSELNAAIKQQVDLLMHTSNLFYNLPTASAAARAAAASGMERVFFTNSGTEAIEGVIKAARKYAFVRDGHADHEIIAMENSFHGRSMGALSVTGNPHYQEAFQPLLPGIRFARMNDLASVEAQITEKTCAILLETVQGEGGIYPAEAEFLQGVRRLCDQKELLLILDEIQCGMGRCGEMFAWQHYGVKPDLMACAKAIGSGVPVGAFFLTEQVAAQSLAPGDHGSTYGGNPLVGAAVDKVFEIFERDKICDHVKEISAYLEQRLDELEQECPCITGRRGLGLMQGLVLSQPVAEVVKEALKQGLIVITAGGNVLRLLPPLVIEREHVDEMIEKLKRVLTACDA